MGNLLRIMVLQQLLFGVSLTWAEAPKKVIGYYLIQGIHSGYWPKDMPLEHLTHAIYSFVDISPEGECAMINDRRTYSDIDERIITQFGEIKKLHPHLKTLFSIGGATHSQRFSDVALSEASRRVFIQSCLNLMKRFSFDGIDLDWEVVGFKTRRNPNSRPEDDQNFIKLIAEFRQALPPGALLSAAIAPGPEITAHLDIGLMAQYLDWFGIMDYALCGDWSKRTCHQSDYALTGKNSIETYLKLGAKKEQIILGVPFFGHFWKVESIQDLGMGQLIIAPTPADPYGDYLTFQEIKTTFLEQNGFKRFWDPKFNQPVLVNESEKSIISYDDEESLGIKAREVRKQGYGGMLIWEISEDDQDHSLLKTMSSILLSN